MRLSSLLACFLTASVGAACSSASSSTSSTPAPSSSASQSGGAATARAFSANIVPTGVGNSRIAGTITLTPLDANTYSLAMELRGGPASRQLPWAIRPGSCGDVTPNSDIGSRSAYSPIQTQADGQSHVNSRLRIELPQGQTLHVDIMQSQTQRDMVVGCGVLLAR